MPPRSGPAKAAPKASGYSRRSKPIDVEAHEVPIVDPERETLHRLMDEILDRRPDLQRHMIRLLTQTMDRIAKPDAGLALSLLANAKRVLEALDVFAKAGGK